MFELEDHQTEMMMVLKQKAHSEVQVPRKLETGSQWRTEAVPEEGGGIHP